MTKKALEAPNTVVEVDTRNRPDATIWVFSQRIHKQLPAPRPWLRDPRVGVIVQALAGDPLGPMGLPPGTELPRSAMAEPLLDAVARQLAMWGLWHQHLARLAGREDPLPLTYWPNGLGRTFIPMWITFNLDAAAEQCKRFFQSLRDRVLNLVGYLPRTFHLDIEGVPGTGHEVVELVRAGEDLDDLDLSNLDVALEDAGFDYSIRLRSRVNEQHSELVDQERARWRARMLERVVWTAVRAAFEGDGVGLRYDNYATPSPGFASQGPIAKASIVAYEGQGEDTERGKPATWRCLNEIKELIHEAVTAGGLGSLWMMSWEDDNQHDSLRNPSAFRELSGIAVEVGSDICLFRDEDRDWTTEVRMIPRHARA